MSKRRREDVSGLVDLHRHLDGSLRPSTLAELAAGIGLPIPENLHFHAGMGLDAALACFETTLAVLQSPEAIARVAKEICEDAEADGVTTLEIRFAPQLHGNAGAAVDAALAGIAGRAGLLVCGLYGEAPSILSEHVALARDRPGIVGIDLAGGPTPSDQWQLSDYAMPFAAAREMGLGRTVHAGEGRSVDEIRVAIEVLGAQRIGHGTTLLDDPHVLALAIEHAITIEACPTSNVHVGAIAAVSEHPLRAWLEAGVGACICTDNTLFSDVSSSQEIENISKALDLSASDQQTLVSNGHGAAFVRS